MIASMPWRHSGSRSKPAFLPHSWRRVASALWVEGRARNPESEQQHDEPRAGTSHAPATGREPGRTTRLDSLFAVTDVLVVVVSCDVAVEGHCVNCDGVHWSPRRDRVGREHAVRPKTLDVNARDERKRGNLTDTKH